MKLISRVEELILLAVLRLGEEAYCVTIYEHLNRLSPREWTLGTIYGPLYRLEKNGLLESYLGPSSPERGGKSKRFFRLTGEGMDVLREIRHLQEESWQGVHQLLEES
jgi:DNA-binding PadR family transcriptional regulator